MSREPDIDEIQQIYTEWKARTALLELPPRYVPDKLEIRQLQILMAAAGNERAFQCWIKEARKELKRPRGHPRQHDMQWLMLAAFLKRSDKTLSRKAAIEKVADLEQIPNKDAFVRRLQDKLEGHSLEEYAEAWERLGVTFTRSWPPPRDGEPFGKLTHGGYPASGVRGALWMWT
jgi:hypothetical protein